MRFGRLPGYNDREPYELPADMLGVLEMRAYLDDCFEALSYHTSVPAPSRRILLSPREFRKWLEWAKRQEDEMREHKTKPQPSFADPWMMKNMKAFAEQYGG